MNRRSVTVNFKAVRRKKNFSDIYLNGLLSLFKKKYF